MRKKYMGNYEIYESSENGTQPKEMQRNVI